MSNNPFQNVVSENKRYNNFPLGREVLLSGQIGKLIPVQCDEVVPGDRWNQSAAFLCRFTPLSAPAMARFNVHFHTFYVPYRIITPETSRESTYEKFIKSIGKHSDEVPILPFMWGYTNPSRLNLFGIGSLADYLGYPTGIFNIDRTERITILPFLAYQRIYQDFYRRDQIEAEKVFPCDIHAVNLSFIETGIIEDPWPNAVYDDIEEGQERATAADLFTLQTRNYERDYFTSALPEPQFGDEVAIGDGNINWVGQTNNIDFSFDPTDYAASIYTQLAYPVDTEALFEPNGTRSFLGASTGNDIDTNLRISNGSMTGKATFGQSFADNLQGNSITINEFRLAMQLQGIKEKINRVGTRYLEIMQGIYGVRVPDARLQRPVYLGGFKNPVTIGSVMQTSQTTETSAQGTLTGQMSASGSNRLCNSEYEFKEHGYIMTIMSITPRTSYYGGMPKKYMKHLPEQFYLPQFDHLGEQSISKAELYYKGNETDYGDFGYQLRYAEYKSSLSTVHGEFRTTLDNWHVSRDFDEVPSLNPSFIKAEPEDFDRIFAFQNVEGTSNEHFQMQVYIDVVAKRNMSKYSTPYTLY